MSATIEQIRTALAPYVSDRDGLAGFPEELLGLLEEADGAAKETAESIEGMLALYAVNKISSDFLKKEIRALLNLGSATELAVASVRNLRPLDPLVFENLFPSTSRSTDLFPDPLLPTLWGMSPSGNIQTGYVFVFDQLQNFVVTNNFDVAISRVLFESESPKPGRSYSVELVPPIAA